MQNKRKTSVRWAVCLDNSGYEASLEIGKLYRILRDPVAARHGYVRVVDESGEDYGYTADRFAPMRVPRKVARALLVAT